MLIRGILVERRGISAKMIYKDNDYAKKADLDLKVWIGRMSKKPSVIDLATRKIQTKVNSIIPSKAHQIITDTIKNLVKVILWGSEFTTTTLPATYFLEDTEKLVADRARYYKRAAMTSGAWTGAGGLLLGLADFPILLSLKIKFLFEAAYAYGFDTEDYKERLYILHIFLLAFSSHETRRELLVKLLDWNKTLSELPDNLESYDWKSFQQEYRDYIDMAKLLQLLPGIGAVVGAYANYKLMGKLEETAINAYRLRLLNSYDKI